MKKLSLILALFLVSCSTLATQKQSYKELTAPEFVALAEDNMPSRGQKNFFYYAGSDDLYDYLYSQTGAMLADQHYHEYKMKRGILNLPERFDFNPVAIPSPGPTAGRHFNYLLLYYAKNDEEIKTSLQKLLNEPTSQP